ncbi:choice-of-anchor J domain-containing protein [Flavobacterium sp. CS20]|uniref:choice-of-anchor J domain-containing protein n=1 Tax=Flavobacterium sp. CS20 TaxID=2775246 RepID=UPI001B3A22C6|nr:choice-of-anchor J domain-containing protein [Flavobacterium sp. CS20]QTY27998.1 choice-of-anchor J domain-containing protein [Flavobacterium sp. CS20]
MSDGQSVQSQPVAFSIPCTVFTAPYFNDFEAFPVTTNLTEEDCWIEDSSGSFGWDVGTGGTISSNTGPSGALSGNNYVFTEASSGTQGDEAILLSPLVDLSTLTQPALSFWYHMYGADMGTLAVDVKISTSVNFDLDVFTLSGEQQTAETDSWIQQFVDLSTYAGETIQFRFRVTRGNGFTSDLAIEDVLIDEAPSCLTPTGLTVSNITETTADLSWSVIGNATSGYNWFVFNAGDDPDVDTPVASGSTAAGVTTANVTNLPSSSFLEAYIQSNCGATDGLSEFSPAVSFETLCDVIPTPYFEDFEFFTVSTSFDEDGCWNEESLGSFTWDVGTGNTTSSNTGPDAAFSGLNYLFSEASSGSQGDESIVLSPQVDLSNLTTPAVSFRYHMYGADIDQLSVDIDDGTTLDLDVFTIVGEQQTSETDDWVQVFVDLMPYAGQTIQVRFRVTRGDGFEGDVAIDDVNFDEAPTCFDPLNLEVISVTDISADLSWQAGSTETNFDVEVVPAGTPPTGTPTFEDVSVPFTATGLTSETDYDFYVRADCGPGDVSNWVGPEGFTTALTPVTVVVNDPAINNTYCYDNNEFKEWLFVSSDIQITPPTPVEVIFNGGTIEDGTGSTDRFRVFNGFDQTAPRLYDSDAKA